MKRLLVLAALVLGVLAAVAVAPDGLPSSPDTAEAHPGGTDSNGCHECRTNCTERWGISYGYYHRHNPVRPCFAESDQPVEGPPAQEPEPAPQDEACDTAYPSICVPSPPPDLDCADIMYEDFTVQGPDPHGFDGDSDGIGCESDGASASPADGDTSEVAGASSAPVAGLGPGDLNTSNPVTLLIAGLAGAGIAWLVAGSGIAVGSMGRRLSVPRPPQRPEFLPRMRPVGRDEPRPRGTPFPQAHGYSLPKPQSDE